MTERKGTHAQQWREAEQLELANQKKKGLYVLVPRKAGRHVIGGKWVYRVKYTVDGTIKKFSARWCAKGYTQRAGRGYIEKAAPFVRSETSRILLAIATAKGWQIKKYDVETAFSNSKIDKELYRVQPTGHEEGDNVCELRHALYGLVQSAYLWFEDLKATLLSMKLTQSNYDVALFYAFHQVYQWINQSINR